MKKIIFKGLICILFISAFWSCSTENDVQMQDTGQIQQKDGSILDGIIGEDLGNGQYQIIVNQNELMRELERMVVEGGVPVKIDNVQIINKNVMNQPGITIPVLVGGGLSTDGSSVSVGLGLSQIDSQVYVDAAPKGERPPRIICTGCAYGCFIEYYKIDATHLLGYCDSAGCGDYCFRTKLD